MCTLGMFHSSPQKWHFFKCIKPSKEERFQSFLPKPDGPLAHLKPSSAIEAANSAICEILTYGMISEDSPSPCNKVIFKTVCI